MSPLRWVSVCCFVVCGWCAGDSFHQQAQAHLEALRKTLDLLETLHEEISFRRSGREDQAMMTTLAGLVVVLSILVKQISVLFVTIKSLFAL